MPISEFHGEVSTDDASGTGVALTIYPQGSTTAYTLLSTQRVEIYEVEIITAAGGAIGLYCDTDAAGKRIVKGTVAATGGIARSLAIPYLCPVGVVPKLIAPAGQIDCLVRGKIRDV